MQSIFIYTGRTCDSTMNGRSSDAGRERPATTEEPMTITGMQFFLANILGYSDHSHRILARRNQNAILCRGVPAQLLNSSAKYSS